MLDNFYLYNIPAQFYRKSHIVEVEKTLRQRISSFVWPVYMYMHLCVFLVIHLFGLGTFKHNRFIQYRFCNSVRVFMV